MKNKLKIAAGFLILLIIWNIGGAKKKTLQQSDDKMDALLKHFKECKDFPFVVDSAYISKVKNFDSLGGDETKMLINQWCNDSLISDENHNIIMQEFYTIDSLKAHHKYAAWQKNLDIGMTEYATVYALQKVELKHGISLLVWALATDSYEADPVSSRRSVYFTIWDGKNLGQTFILGEQLAFADPPSGSETHFYGTLTKDGKLVIKQSQLTEDYDSGVGQLSTSQIEYQISAEGIKRTKSSFDKDKTIKLSNE